MRIASLGIAGLVLLAPGCFTSTHVRDERGREEKRYLDVRWHTDVDAAFAEARASNKPVLLVGASGELDGPSCLGAARVREDALSDPAVVALIEQELVPLWVNTREQPWPDLPAVSQDTWSLMLDEEHRIQSPFYRFFFVRTLVVSPDAESVLNLDHGMTRRYTPEPDLYLQMLRASVARHKAGDPGPQDAWRFLLI